MAYKNLLLVNKMFKTNRLKVWLRWPFNEQENDTYIRNEFIEIKDYFESKSERVKTNTEC